MANGSSEVAGKLILVRHSIPAIDLATPSHEWSLTAEGRFRCQALAEQLKPYQPQQIITSTEHKAFETGALIAQLLDVPVRQGENLHEHERTADDWMDDKQAFVETIKQLFHAPDELIFGRETANQSSARFSSAVLRYVAEYAPQTVAIVTHGTVMSLFLNQYNDIDVFLFWSRLKMPDFIVLNLPDYSIDAIFEQVNE